MEQQPSEGDFLNFDDKHGYNLHNHNKVFSPMSFENHMDNYLLGNSDDKKAEGQRDSRLNLNLNLLLPERDSFQIQEQSETPRAESNADESFVSSSSSSSHEDVMQRGETKHNRFNHTYEDG